MFNGTPAFMEDEGNDTRERLARHLWIADGGGEDTWDNLSEGAKGLAVYNGRTGSNLRLDGAAEREKFLARADEILAVIAGREG
jgi:hypothetical protein